MSRADDLRAELALAELEDELVAAKAARNTPEVLELKDQLRAIRGRLAELVDPEAEARFVEVKERVRAARAAARIAREG